MKGTPTTKDALDLFMRGSRALAKMEASGVRVDVTYLDKAIETATRQITEAEQEMEGEEFYRIWRKKYGDRMNLESYTQMGDVLYNEMGQKPTEYTDKGKPSCSKKTLEKLKNPFLQKFFRTQEKRKALNTYLIGIKRELVGEFIRPSYNMSSGREGESGGAKSFRISCSEPNWQNQPSRNKMMAEMIRRCYIPRKGRRIVEVDLVGAEVRVSACYNKDPNLIKYIKDPTTDMHRDLAAQLFFLSVEFLVEHKDWAKKHVRDWAKNRATFPFFYGSVYFQIAPALWEAVEEGHKLPCGKLIRDHLKEHGIKKLGDCEPGQDPRKGTYEYHVKEIERDFWDKRFAVYAKWKRERYETYLREGELHSLTGFRYGGVMKRNDATNYEIQGSSFHCILWTHIELQAWLDKYKMDSLIIGTIHDSIIADVVEDELQDFCDHANKLISEKLPKAWTWLIVPMEAEFEVTPIDGAWNTKMVWSKTNGKWAPKEKVV